MTARLKPYAAYKDSAVAWLGQVPEHSGIQDLRSLQVTSYKIAAGT